MFRRAKEKRLKKDAGRHRWSPYFRQMKHQRPDDSDSRQSGDEHSDNSTLDGFPSEWHSGVLPFSQRCLRNFSMYIIFFTLFLYYKNYEHFIRTFILFYFRINFTISFFYKTIVSVTNNNIMLNLN